jgi:hypothetical protein
LGTWLFLGEQLKPLSTLRNCFHPFHLWVKKINWKKVWTHVTSRM